jgi:hypothetical protein
VPKKRSAQRRRRRSGAVGEHRRDAGLLTLCEVLGHVDLLMNDGRVRALECDAVTLFEPA